MAEKHKIGFKILINELQLPSVNNNAFTADSTLIFADSTTRFADETK